MTTRQRMTLPAGIHTNGADEAPWWANAVAYQIYPRSFQDTNGDGYGDLRGIIRRLPYLADLGIDVIWLSPVYKSPQDDNGYDIADYQAIDPMFGTMDDMDELLDAAHALGIKVIMDLVVNHTSDEHPWFQASRDKGDPHADWYWWRPAREGHEPGTPGAEPNHWGSYFGGSAWTYDPWRGEYYLHQFSKKQPDLNWENPHVRRAVYDMMNWWLDKGVDGFRMDVITLISKHVADTPEGTDPAVAGLPDEGEIGEEGYSNVYWFCEDGPRLDEFLQEMHREVFDGRDGYLTVGEGTGIAGGPRDGFITDPHNRELDMLFIFTHMDVDLGDAGKWTPVPMHLPDFKRAMGDQQAAVADNGWASVFLDNHDQPRVISRWGDDTSEEGRVKSAKAWALVAHMHRGMPYIYQGEELGMTNAGFTRLDQYRDLESINMYHQRVDQGLETPEDMLDAMAKMSRDNARTPMQWDSTTFAGFTRPDAATAPWIEVNPNHTTINAASQMDDPDSVRSFYKRLIELRHTNPVVTAGEWIGLDPEDEQVYDFLRVLPLPRKEAESLESRGREERTLLTVVNCSAHSAHIPPQAAALLGGGVDPTRIVISTTDPEMAAASLLMGKLSPWEGIVYEL